MIDALASSLKGLRVIDASRVLAGPYAGQILADLGADVIKVEQPDSGDETRGWGPPYVGDLSAYFLACNRGKRSIVLDLRTSDDRDLWNKLIARADILVENFKPSSIKQLNVDAATLHKINPQLIICSLSGFGRSGSFAGRPGYDFVVQAMSGMMAATGPKAGPPYKFGVAIADIVTGLYASIAILAALRHRLTTGMGLAIELSLMDCAVATMANVGQSYVSTSKVPTRQGNAHAQIVPYELFASADGWVVLAVGNDQQWQRFCSGVGRHDLATDGRFLTNDARVQRREDLVPLVAEIMRTKSTGDWEHLLGTMGVPCGPIWDLQTLMTSKLAKERNFVVKATQADGTEVDLLRSPIVRNPGPLRAPPALDANRDEIVRDWLAP
jgi:crotonobetainyl-CoA:carnitine CoA-transferase CaiB-like acyl-CoA transferase